MMEKFKDIESQLKEIYDEYKKISELLTYEEVLVDKKLFLSLENKKRTIQAISTEYVNYLKLIEQQEELCEVINQLTDSEKVDFVKELEGLNNHISLQQDKLIIMYKGINTQMQNIAIEIVATKEILSDELSEMLINSYYVFCLKNNLHYEKDTDKNKIVLYVSGYNAYEYFKSEIGVHKCVDLNNVGLCQVFVYNDVKNDFIEIKDEEISIIACRSSGAGGQHINTTDSAIKATHNKTGISVVCQDERSQFQNKEIAISHLKDKVVLYYEKEKKENINKQKKNELKFMKNNRYVKLYDYKQGKVYTIDNREILLKDFKEGNII